MTIFMPYRNIPVKHLYSSGEFGGAKYAGILPPMNNIVKIRKARNLTQTDLADLAGVEQSTISKLERGGDSVTLRTLNAVATALGVSIADLFASRSEAEIMILDAYRQLPPERQKGWQDLAQSLRIAPNDPQSTPKT